jgi:hypothetical protein
MEPKPPVTTGLQLFLEYIRKDLEKKKKTMPAPTPVPSPNPAIETPISQ